MKKIEMCESCNGTKKREQQRGWTMKFSGRTRARMREMAQRWNSRMVVAAIHVVYKREKEGAHKGMTERGLLEINRNVTIFQWLLPYRARLSPHFFLSLSRSARPDAPYVYFSPFSLYPACRKTCEKIETRKQRVVTCARRWKKRSEVSWEGEAAVMYIQGMKQLAGMVVKKRRLVRRTGEGS